MSILDYHRRTLCPEIWSPDEQVLRPKVRDHLFNQVRARFAGAKGVLLVGDLTGHYYTDDSDLDLLVVSQQEDQVRGLLQESQYVSGYLLDGTQHPVNFHVLHPGTAAAALASKFGPVYDLNSGLWYGRRVLDTSEMSRVDAVREHLTWRLYKAKGSVQLSSPKWNVLNDAFSKLPGPDRQQVIDWLKMALFGLDRNIRRVIKAFNQAEVWTSAARFAQVLNDGARDDELAETMESLSIPREVAAAIVNRYRYENVLDKLEQLDQKLRKTEDGDRGEFAGMRVSSRQDPLIDRLSSVLDSLIVAGGGIGTAADSVAAALEAVLRHSRYLATGQRRQMILKKLQDAFSSDEGSHE
jgi:hypothetical protein